MDETASYLRHACRAWEKLRVLYNLVLLVEFVLLLKPAVPPLRAWVDFHDPETWRLWLFPVLFFGFPNAVYCLGPLFEIYAWALLDWRIGRARYSLFLAVLALALISIRISPENGVRAYWLLVYYYFLLGYG